MSRWSIRCMNYSTSGPLCPPVSPPFSHLTCFTLVFPASTVVAPSSLTHPTKLTVAISQPRPVERPAEYPQWVLWTITDCKLDPNVGLSPTNMSQIPMWHAACHGNSDMLTDSEWKVIRQSAVSIICAHLLSINTSGFVLCHGRDIHPTWVKLTSV
jgi:hypothetical protein